MSERTVLAFPRQPFRAQRQGKAFSRKAGWSTLIRRTWHTDEEFGRDWVPAAVVYEVFDAARDAVALLDQMAETGYALPALADRAAKRLRDALDQWDRLVDWGGDED